MTKMVSVFLCALTAGASVAFAQAGPRPLPLTDVSIQDSFWSPKYATWRNTTIRDCLDKFEKSGAMTNFDLIRDGKKAGVHHGEPWFDGLVYEMITACSDFMVQQPDPALEARLDGFIDRIAAAGAKDPDGYLNTYTSAKEPDHRWGANGGNDRYQHDLYNGGCLVEAGVHYYRATGKTKLLQTAVRMADLMANVMGPAPKKNLIPGHAIPEQAFFELYKLFKQQPDLKSKIVMQGDEDRYLKLAQFWIDARGHHEGRQDFGSYNQDHVPVAQQQTIEGHAVRAVLLATGMSMIGREANRPDYLPIALRWWQNMVHKRSYVTGGVGATAEDEKFGGDYFLPNTGYAETCAAVGRAFFDAQILQQTGDALAADEFERSLYNGALTGVSLAGTSYFYENPLAADEKKNRWDWHGCPCCPPMFLKLMGRMPTNIYSADDKGVYVNLFIGSKARANVGTTELMISQETTYPTTGEVKVKIEPKQAASFAVNIRVPGWCQPTAADALYDSRPTATPKSFELTINGKPAEYAIERGYARLNRQWSPGDTVEVKIDVFPRRVMANEAVEADRGRVALAAGPIVYCIESTDQSVPIDQLTLPASAGLKAETAKDLLGGVTVLRGQAVTKADARPVDFTAIPFYATANRGPRTMKVWIPAAK